MDFNETTKYNAIYKDIMAKGKLECLVSVYEKTGGQWGHEGKTLEKVENPDDVIEHKIPEMCGCGYNLGQVNKTRKNPAGI